VGTLSTSRHSVGLQLVALLPLDRGRIMVGEHASSKVAQAIPALHWRGVT